MSTNLQLASVSTEDRRLCRRKHKYLAKLSIDSGLLATTMIQLRLVLRADKETYPLLIYLLVGFISLSLVLQAVVMMLYISVHSFRNRGEYSETKFVITECIFVVTILNTVTAVLLEALVEPK